jgi:hypothetical protein
LGEYLIPAGEVEIGQGINAEHPAKVIEFIGLGTLLVGRGGALQ